jgi:hypothetical protein
VTTCDSPPRLNSHLTFFTLLLSLALLAYLLAANAAQLFRADDFVQYWAAGRLNLSGGNPYDGAQLYALQRSVGWEEAAPLMMWNPPWMLALAMPLSLLPYTAARALWLLGGFAIIILCADVCWRLYGGVERRRWVAWLVALFFTPTMMALKLGQISPLVLLGVVGFLYATTHERWMLAGISAALIAVKPQLLYLLWPVLLLWALQMRNWRLPVALAATLLVSTGVALAANPLVVKHYLHLNLNETPFIWATPTLGSLLRYLLGDEKHWLQFIPAVLGCVWLIQYWQRNQSAWRWTEQMPLVLLVSLVTMPFGWTYDGVILIPAAVQATVWLARGQRRLHSAIGAIAHIILVACALAVYGAGWTDFANFWLAPALLAMYLVIRRVAMAEPLAAAQMRG